MTANQLAVGDTAPAFSLPDAKGNTVSLADYAGEKVIIYFYPKAMTPGYHGLVISEIAWSVLPLMVTRCLASHRSVSSLINLSLKGLNFRYCRMKITRLPKRMGPRRKELRSHLRRPHSFDHRGYEDYKVEPAQVERGSRRQIASRLCLANSLGAN